MENTVDKEVASQAYHDEPPLHADLNAMKSKSFMESFSREFQNISISSGRRRRKLIIGLLCLLIATLMVYFGHSSSYRQVLSWNHPSDPTPIYLGPAVPFKIHPIVQLVAENEAKFSKLVNKQSKTLKEAVVSWKRPSSSKWTAPYFISCIIELFNLIAPFRKNIAKDMVATHRQSLTNGSRSHRSTI